MNAVYNFSAGPAKLPETVLKQVQEEFLDWQGTGCSVVEVSHRGPEFMAMAEQSIQDLRDLLNIPDNYKVLFSQGGGRGQFAALPLNILGDASKADYVNTGYWSESAIKEAQKYCEVNEITPLHEVDGKQALKPVSEWDLSDDAAYVHICWNETIDGVHIKEVPETDKIIVADMSSSILSEPVDVSKFGVIYAGAQKNIGPAGITIIIIREDLLGKCNTQLPSVLNYEILESKESMFNTPATFSWYVTALVFKWLKQQGGSEAMLKVNQQKAELLYNYIDSSDFYANGVHPSCRSLMNVPFFLKNEALNAQFVKESTAAGLKALKGHRIRGGMRASIYNAMPLEGVQALVTFLDDFAKANV